MKSKAMLVTATLILFSMLTIGSGFAKAAAPPAGGGGCAVAITNSTPLYVNIYVDGAYRGIIAPWGGMYVYTGAGPTELYAVAVFNDGSRYNWGPWVVGCYSTYRWRLTY